MEDFEIYVRLIECTNKDGKKFNAYETCDTKDKKRLSVAFLRDGMEPLKQSAKIKVLAARMDLSKRYPILRISNYAIVNTDTPKEDSHIKEFFG